MDKRIKYMIVLDTETCPMDRELQKVTPSNMLVYDVGWAVVDKRGNVYEQRSFVNTDVFMDEAEMMKSAYYADKLPSYWEEMRTGERVATSLYRIRQHLINDIEKYNIKEIYAHNMFFDLSSLNNTQRWETKSKYRYFFPYGLKICDTLRMSRDVVGKMPSYRRFCEANGYLTARGQLRFTAEILYRFITKDNEFTEQHKGIDDVMIEKEILAYCYKQHKKMRKELFN